jgi:Ca-activated chloride channel family protein
MIGFELVWVFYLLPVPLLAYWVMPKARQQQAAVRVPFFSELSELQHKKGNSMKHMKLHTIAVAAVWCSLVAAAAGPTWIGDPINLPSSGRDLLLAVDLSGSMKIEDMEINGDRVPRIVAVKTVLAEFIQRRTGDRLGLVLFGSQAYVQAPLTFDQTTVQRFMREAQIGFAGEENTAIGDAIGLSVKRLRDRPGDRHVMILLTDGQNNGGEVNPIPASKLAADNGIVIYTIGVGADEMVMPGVLGSSFGSRRVNPSADLDEKTLQEIATMTGGQYFRARNSQQLEKIYLLLDKLEPVEDKKETFRPQKSLFYWPLGLAFILSGLIAIIKFPWRDGFRVSKTKQTSPSSSEGLHR